MLDEMVTPCISLAVQYTCFPSCFTTLLNNVEMVRRRPPSICVIHVDWLVMSTDDLYHVMLACGLLAEVVHVKFTCCPAVNVFGVGVKVTDVTGTALPNEMF